MLDRGPRGRTQHQALVPEQAAALRRRRERRTLAASLARSSVACLVWAGVVSMTPPGRVAAAPTLLAVCPSTGILRPDATRVQLQVVLAAQGLAQGFGVL
jgi:hypothetical protein